MSFYDSHSVRQICVDAEMYPTFQRSPVTGPVKCCGQHGIVLSEPKLIIKEVIRAGESKLTFIGWLAQTTRRIVRG